MSVPSPLLPVGLAAVLLLAACSTPSPDPTPAITIGGGVAETPGASSDQPPGGGGQVSADGMPDLPLEGCEELVDSGTEETDFDTQWRFEYACTSRDAFDVTVAALDSLGTLAHPQNAVLGNDSYISDRHHFIGESGEQTLDIDLKLTGAPDDLEMVYLVTLRKPE